VSAFSVSIRRDINGNHVVRFPKLKDELSPPLPYPERIEWIKLSCERFFQKIRDKEALTGAVSSV
jgi:hypothetical protein